MSFSSTLLRTVALAGALTFSGAALAQDAAAQETITIAASPVPHAEILNFIKPELAKQGVNLVVREFTDYVQPAMQTNERNVDGNWLNSSANTRKTSRKSSPRFTSNPSAPTLPATR